MLPDPTLALGLATLGLNQPEHNNYVLGFLFSPDQSQVLLIRKLKPDWQAGKLNGIGGKIEEGESLREAMEREAAEEADLKGLDWSSYCIMSGEDWTVGVLRAFGDVTKARSMTEETLQVCSTSSLPPDCISNLNWLIPMGLQREVEGGVILYE
jgi:8-oxo-dGTP diphosphatase